MCAEMKNSGTLEKMFHGSVLHLEDTKGKVQNKTYCSRHGGMKCSHW